MASLSDLANIPFLGAYVARGEMNRQRDMDEVKQAGTLFTLHEQMQGRIRERQARDALAQSSGDPEKASQILLQTGNYGAASKLAPLIEEKRKATAGRVVPAGAVITGPNNEVLFRNPAAQRPGAQPEVITLSERLAGLPQDHPSRPFIEQRLRYLGREGQETRPFGSGATGGSMELITRLAPGYAAGTLTPDQERQFDMAVAHYTQPRQYQDPDTGLMTTRKPELPAFVQDAVRRRRGARPQPTPAPGPQAEPQPSPGPGAGPQEPQRTTKTVWELSSLITGPIPAAAETLSRTPLVGDLVQAPQFTQARQQVKQLQNDLVRVLMNNPRYAEGERRAIRDEINIDAKLWDNPTSYRDRIIGIDNALEIRERNAFSTAQSARVGREERVQAMNILNAIRNFRENLGIPPRVRSDEDWEALEPGTEYIAPDGRVKKKQ